MHEDGIVFKKIVACSDRGCDPLARPSQLRENLDDFPEVFHVLRAPARFCPPKPLW
jgi:hypothetical protein